MPSTHTFSSPTARPQIKREEPRPARLVARKSSQQAIEEINGYIAIRDGLLLQAEKVTTGEALQRAAIANDLVENCLRPIRQPYEAQFLPEFDAARERERCAAAKVRIAELGAVKL
jgi:hypothetical protein